MTAKVAGEPVLAFDWLVVAYRRPAALELLLAAAAGAPGCRPVVIAVEDDPAIVAVARRHGAVVVPLPGNPGFGAAINAGLPALTAEVVVVSNDDVSATASDLERLVRPVSEGSCAVAVPRIETSSGEVERTVAALPTPGSLAWEWLVLPDRPVPLLGGLRVEKWRLPTRVESIESAMGAVFAVRVDVLTGIPFPEDYFLYWEEQEWFWRLRAHGSRVEYRPEAMVVHDGGRDVRPEKAALMARNAVRCVRRTQGRRAAALAWPVVVLWSMRTLIQDWLRGLLGSDTARRQVPARLVGLRAAGRAWREVR